MYTFDDTQEPQPIKVVKHDNDALEAVWAREVSFDIPPSGPGHGAVGFRVDVSAADGVVGISFDIVTDDSQLSVDGVVLPSPRLSVIPNEANDFYVKERVLVALSDADGGTLAVTITGTAGPESGPGGGSMLNNSIYAMVGTLHETEFEKPGNTPFSMPAKMATEQMVGFCPYLGPNTAPAPSSDPIVPAPSSDPIAGPTEGSEHVPSTPPAYQPVDDESAVGR